MAKLCQQMWQTRRSQIVDSPGPVGLLFREEPDKAANGSTRQIRAVKGGVTASQAARGGSRRRYGWRVLALRGYNGTE